MIMYTGATCRIQPQARQIGRYFVSCSSASEGFSIVKRAVLRKLSAGFYGLILPKL